MTPAEQIKAAQDALREAEQALVTRLGTTRDRARGPLMAQLWQARRMAGAVPHYASQFGQDWAVDTRILRGKRDGTFVDIGGYDGVTGSNTLFFETMRGWTGLLVEPAGTHFEAARQLRRCDCVQMAVAATPGTATFLEIEAGYTQMSGLVDSYDNALLQQVRANPDHRETTLDVPTIPLNHLLRDHGLSQVDFLSLDVEGGERAILEGFPFAEFDVSVWSIENNTGDPAIPRLMQAAGYKLVEFLGVDELYVQAALLDRLQSRSES